MRNIPYDCNSCSFDKDCDSCWSAANGYYSSVIPKKSNLISKLSNLFSKVFK